MREIKSSVIRPERQHYLPLTGLSSGADQPLDAVEDRLQAELEGPPLCVADARPGVRRGRMRARAGPRPRPRSHLSFAIRSSFSRQVPARDSLGPATVASSMRSSSSAFPAGCWVPTGRARRRRSGSARRSRRGAERAAEPGAVRAAVPPGRRPRAGAGGRAAGALRALRERVRVHVQRHPPVVLAARQCARLSVGRVAPPTLRGS